MSLERFGFSTTCLGRRRAEGYTFIELSVVILIILIIVATTVPRFVTMLSGTNLGATARRLAGAMQYVRSEAVRTNKNYYLAIDLDAQSYRVQVLRTPEELKELGEQADLLPEEWTEARYKDVIDQYAQIVRLKPKMVVTDVVVLEGETRSHKKIDKGTVRVEFREDGTAQYAAVHLTDSRGGYLTVYAKPTTGEVEILEGTEQPPGPPELEEPDWD